MKYIFVLLLISLITPYVFSAQYKVEAFPIIVNTSSQLGVNLATGKTFIVSQRLKIFGFEVYPARKVLFVVESQYNSLLGYDSPISYYRDKGYKVYKIKIIKLKEVKTPKNKVIDELRKKFNPSKPVDIKRYGFIHVDK